ncbi:MAG: AAA family ATPase [Terriglobia bacterium]
MRLIRPSIVLLCGPAACGKSTFARRLFRPTQVISSDWARARVCDDERDQRFQTQAFALVHYLAELRLGLNRLCVVDSTALTQHHRKEYLELAKRFQVPCAVFLFDVPLEKCVERDRSRPRTVGRAVIERQHMAFGQTKADVRQEGFDEIIELGDEDMDKVQIEIIFRPISQPAGTPGRRPQGETRHTPRPWQQGTGRGPAVHEAKPPSLMHPPGPSREQTKPEVQPASSPAQAPPVPATEVRQAPNVAGAPAPVEPPSSSAQSTSPTTPDAKATPEP